MAVATQQVLGVNRQPLRVGRIRYGMWCLEQSTSGVRGRARAVTGGTATAGRELLWATELSLRTMTRQAELARPEPWSDGKLLASITVFAVCALVVATVLGIGVARWAMTESNSLLFAAAGALAVGLVFLPLAYLVFASKGGNR